MGSEREIASSLVWCPGCGHSRACDGCRARDGRLVAQRTPCRCTPTALPAVHDDTCPTVAEARALGLDPARDFAPPVIHRRVEEPVWVRRGGRWVQQGVSVRFVPVSVREVIA